MNWFLTLIPAIQQMSSIESAMLTTMVIFFLYRSGANIVPLIKKKKDQKEEEIKKEGSDSPLRDIHRGCKNYSSLAIILEKVMERSDKIVRIKYQDTLYEQMNDAELMWEDVTNHLKDNFAKTFDIENPDIEKSEKVYSVKCYILIIESMETEMMGLIRKWMKKNHFIEKSELSYVDYIEEKIGLLHSKMTRLFDDKYEEDKLLINREALRKNMKENVMPIIHKRGTTFFLRAREISIEKSKLIKEIKDKIDKI